MKHRIFHFLPIIIAALLAFAPTVEVTTAATPPQTTKSKKKTTATKKQTSKKKTAAKPKAKSKSKPASGPKTSAEAKRRQEDTQKEIKLTEQQIKENDRSIKKKLNELGKIETDISESQKSINATTAKISTLNNQIGTLESGISDNEKELTRLREEYLKAVKKMRLAQKNSSDLAFIFASDNFNQALRRMRYLRQFSEWKDRRSAAISDKNRQLNHQKQQLSDARAQHAAALKKQKEEESMLLKQHSEQDAIVAKLKQNGQALKTHLSKKQAEANSLRNQIAALIAEEERKAAEERARQEEARRKAEQERIAREEAAAKAKAEAEMQIARKETAGKIKKEEKTQIAEAKRRTKPTTASKKSDAKSSKKSDVKESGNKNVKVAKNVGRKTTAEKRTAASDGNFASMKGNLPRPASGRFKVTSRFGRQSLPDLPDVVYDNPGIDAEVAAGSSALAVYDGKVSGVYMLPGYNTVVIVNHGAYYTVYGNIASPNVKIGDNVKTGQGLGALAADEDDRSRSSIHFEVWKSREKLNPLEWIR